MLEPTAIATTAAATADRDRIHDEVRARYAEAAIAAGAGRSDSEAAASCCDTHGNATFGQILYDADERAQLPDAAVLASLGCGNPTAVAELRPGERVLDLGSGGGIDVILSARRVGPTGRAIGLDMTDEMLELAVRNAAEAGVDNVEFVRGTIESIPLPAASVDVVISNCVINLAADKAAVFAEIARVLRPGGRVGVSDVVADDSLTPAERAERGSYSGCIAGALSFAEYRTGLAAVGLVDVTIEPTHAVADGLHGAIIKATRPVEAVIDRPAMPAFPRAVAMLDAAADGCGCGSGVCC
ncbi:MAG TPA: arsenite methyltransferase [Verrucomicrobiae bacterium]|nr:arsenite methyltransferase [Verrucomicrobiae bacterium]